MRMNLKPGDRTTITTANISVEATVVSVTRYEYGKTWKGPSQQKGISGSWCSENCGWEGECGWIRLTCMQRAGSLWKKGLLCRVS